MGKETFEVKFMSLVLDWDEEEWRAGYLSLGLSGGLWYKFKIIGVYKIIEIMARMRWDGVWGQAG